MNDKEIRKILIEYLKTSVPEIRIYQEKSIGNSICDIMAVTDCLIGYEIKSDVDNYTRLDDQVRAYDKFFDKNYIVVGESHSKSAESKVPMYWGIIVINKTKVTIKREAKADSSANKTQKQLSILWKLELKNILTKNGLPAMTYQNKRYITNYISENIPKNSVHESIIYELMHRDYSQFDAKDYTIYSDNSESFSNNITNVLPTGELVDMLSEENLDNVTLDQWINLYRQAKEVQNNKELIYNKTEKVSVVNKNAIKINIPFEDINIYPGAPWINKYIIDAFVYFLRTGNEKESYICTEVNYEPITGNWFINNKRGYDPVSTDVVRIEHTYGCGSYNALFIFEAALNLREIKRFNEHHQFDERQTINALEKKEIIINLFKDWVSKDEVRRFEIEKAYNEMFNDFADKKYDVQNLVSLILTKMLSYILIKKMQ